MHAHASEELGNAFDSIIVSAKAVEKRTGDYECKTAEDAVQASIGLLSKQSGGGPDGGFWAKDLATNTSLKTFKAAAIATVAKHVVPVMLVGYIKKAKEDTFSGNSWGAFSQAQQDFKFIV